MFKKPDQNKMRDFLSKWYRDNPMSLNQLAQQIGIGRQSLDRFLSDGIEMQLKQALKVERFINSLK